MAQLGKDELDGPPVVALNHLWATFWTLHKNSKHILSLNKDFIVQQGISSFYQ